MLAVIDNGSIYTEQLIRFLSKQNVEYEICDIGKTSINDWTATLTEKYLTRFDSFILTGRKENNRVMNKVNTEIIKHTISQKKKIAWDMLWC